MKHYSYTTHGTCSKVIDVTVDDNGCVADVKFTGGCNGNLKGICALVSGRKAAEVKATLAGITCKDKSTSCPDQLAQALADMGF